MIKKVEAFLKHSFWDTLSTWIKKFKTSKSYWSVSYIVILFTLREAGALVYGTILKEYVQKHLEGSDYTWLWSAIEFVFGFGGSIELVILGLSFFVVLSLVKISEGENNTISLKENFLSLLLSFAIVGMGIYMIRSNSIKHKEIFKNQKIMIENDENIYKLLVKVAQNKEIEFLEKYFGKDYAVILKNPQTYHNFTTLLTQTNKSADELLKEREELLKKIASKSFNSKLQKQIDKAFGELRYEDARELIDGFLKANSDKEKEIIKAHYIKALSYMEQMSYQKAKVEFERIALNVDDQNILFDRGYVNYILGDFTQSVSSYKKILQNMHSQISDYQPGILMVHDYMGLSLYENGEYDKAIKYYKKSLKIRLAFSGEKNIDIAINYLRIISALDRKGDYDKSVNFYSDKSSEILDNFMEKTTLNCKKNKFCMSLLEYSKFLEYMTASIKTNSFLFRSLQYYKPSLEINSEKSTPPITNDNNYSSICDCKCHNNIYSVIPKKYDISLNIKKQIYISMGKNCFNLGNYNMAFDNYKKSLKIQLTSLGENHPYTALIYEYIGFNWSAKNEPNKALEYYKKSLKIRQLTLRKNHMDIAMSYQFIGNEYHKKKDYIRAIKCYKKALLILRNQFPDGHSFTTITTKYLKHATKSLNNAN